MTDHKLFKSLADVRRRLLGISLASGVAWGIAACIVVLFACAWVDLALDLPSGMRLTCAVLAMVCGLGLIGWAALQTTRAATQAALAWRLDSAANSRGQIRSGVDLYHQYTAAGGTAAASVGGLSSALARMAIERAGEIAGSVRAASVVPAKPVVTPLATLCGIGIVIAILSLIAPRLVSTQWSRFSDPFGDHPPYSSITFDIQPGDTRVLYGNALDVRAKATGGAVEQLDLVLLPAGARSQSAEDVLPMFPEQGGTWRATVADVTTAGRYFVRAHGARSRQFSYELITVPELREVKFRVTPPAYTRRPPYEGPLPPNGLAGLPGTKVEVWAASNRPLSGGQLKFTPTEEAPPATSRPTTTPAAPAQQPAAAANVGPITLTPTAPGASEVTGSFIITRAGKMELNVKDVAGQASKEWFPASVSILHDDRPFVRILEPRASSYATPDVTLNISMQAEDDYGITRLQLFRSLNDSRPLSLDAPIPQVSPVRLPVTVPLPLAEYGLVPGDIIRLFARVEDNDPAGSKGSESSIVTVQIISREDLNRMTLAREGLEVLQSKYEEARRRLESLDNEIKKLQEELKGLDPKSALAKEKQDKLKKLADRVEEETEAIARNAAEDLPFDLDKNLRENLKQLAKDIREAGKKFKEATKQAGISTAQAGKALEDLQKELGTKKKEFQEEATDPIEHLAKIFPLKEDEARFADLYNRQRDLADRMAALKAQATDDPKSKSRMRDLETEQRQLRDELRELLDSVDSHIQGLPNDPKLADLKKSAEKFLKGVRESQAAEQMQGSETALSEFKGSDAAKQAKDAADTLEKFISQCQGMGEQAGMCLKFQPKLSAGLGNTVEQLLAAEGLTPGPDGKGNGGGYSSRRSTLNNVGLYGSLPRMSNAAAKSGSGKSVPGGMTSNEGNPDGSGDASDLHMSGRLKAAGESGANVPAVYRKKVGEYFQRVADELGE